MPPAAAAPPLSGIRVLDLTTARGEIAGKILADLGAEVLKIEPPEGCDSRRMPPFEDGREGDPDGSLYWAAYGRGKRSITLDIASAEGRDATAYARRRRGHLAGVVRAGAPGRPRTGLRGAARAQPGAGLRLDHAVRAERAGRPLAGDGPDGRGGGRAALADRRRRPAARAGRLPAGRAARRRSGRRGRRRRPRRARPIGPRPAPRCLDAGLHGLDADGRQRLPAQHGRRQARLRRRPRRAPTPARVRPGPAARDRGSRWPRHRHDGRQPAAAHRCQRNHRLDARGRHRTARTPPAD